MKRIQVKKTYKNFIDGQFPRTESGRHYEMFDNTGEFYANLCLSSRKDLRNATVAARKGFATWSGKSAFNRSQILYRLAEMTEGRKAQLISELQIFGCTEKMAITDVNESIDLLIHYAGWCDKYSALLSSVNPVNSSHFNFSILEPIGVVAVIAPEKSGLTGFLSSIIPVLVAGNSCVTLASETHGNLAITFAEILHCSDVPSGVVNIITGKLEELAETIGSHMDINGLFISRPSSQSKGMVELGANSVKRIIEFDLDSKKIQSPLFFIQQFTETKTTWHPIEPLLSASVGY